MMLSKHGSSTIRLFLNFVVIATSWFVLSLGDGECLQGECLAEESKVIQFKQFLTKMFDINNNYKPPQEKANRTEQERIVLKALMEHIDMDPTLIGKRLTKEDGNWFEAMHKRIVALAPEAFFKVYDDDGPTEEEFSDIIGMDDRARKSAETRQDGEMVLDEDLLLRASFRPNRHRGLVARLVDPFRIVILDPISYNIGFAVPSEAVLNRIAEFAPLVELGAGTGYWSAVLQQRGVDIVAYDSEPPTLDKNNIYFHKTYTDVLRGECTSVFEEMKGTIPALLLVWPNNPDNVDNDGALHSDKLPPVWDADCLSSYMAAGGSTVIFVGEREENVKVMPDAPSEVGLSATRRFQNMLRENFQLVDQLELARWFNVDDVTIWKRKAQAD